MLLSSLFITCNVMESYNAVMQVCRNAETGESKGSAYVTMGSYNAAQNALAALDGSVSHYHIYLFLS